MEREVRYAKREAAMMEAAGNKEGFEEAALKVKQKQTKLREFVAEHDNLVMRSDRTQVMGYNRSVSSKAVGAARHSLEREFASPASGRFLLHTVRLYVNAAKIKPLTGYDDFVIHGDKLGFELRNHDGKTYKNVSVKKFVEMIKGSPVYSGGAIRLIACEAGADGSIVAQAVADLLNVNVMAPSDVVWVHADGSITIGAKPTDNTGEWRIFVPRKE